MSTKTYWLLMPAILFFSTSISAQRVHKDQYEYGYKGKVKQIVKKTYSCGGENCELLDFDEKASLTHIYYYNPHGNIDSTVATRYMEAQLITLTTKYQFTNSRKSGWETVLQDGDQYAHALTTWISDREYMEKIYGPDKQLQVELRYWLNDSFRLAKLQSKIFGKSLKIIQESVQKFEFDETGNIKNYTTTQSDGSTVFARYKYLKTDHWGNPLKLVIDKEGEESKSAIILTFSYYD